MSQVIGEDEDFSKYICLQRFGSWNLKLKQNIRIIWGPLKKILVPGANLGQSEFFWDLPTIKQNWTIARKFWEGKWFIDKKLVQENQ